MYAAAASHWAISMAVVVRWSSVGSVFVPPSEVVAVIYLPAVNVRCFLTT